MSMSEQSDPTSFAEVLGSVAAAFFGVQSSRQRRRDFSHGNPWHYILVGLGMTGAVVGVFWLAVQAALRYAG